MINQNVVLFQKKSTKQKHKSTEETLSNEATINAIDKLFQEQTKRNLCITNDETEDESIMQLFDDEFEANLYTSGQRFYKSTRANTLEELKDELAKFYKIYTSNINIVDNPLTVEKIRYDYNGRENKEEFTRLSSINDLRLLQYLLNYRTLVQGSEIMIKVSLIEIISSDSRDRRGRAWFGKDMTYDNFCELCRNLNHFFKAGINRANLVLKYDINTSTNNSSTNEIKLPIDDIEKELSFAKLLIE